MDRRAPYWPPSNPPISWRLRWVANCSDKLRQFATCLDVAKGIVAPALVCAERTVISMNRSLAMTTIPKADKGVRPRPGAVFGVAVLMSLLSASAFAQSVSSGVIEGTVKDESNLVLPGVTITISSPSLQVGTSTQVSDTSGNYKFVDLPAGTYQLKAELPGFSTYLRDELRLTVGFNAKVDLVLKVGAMEESVTVSGQSPVVDVTSTAGSVAFTKEVLDS